MTDRLMRGTLPRHNVRFAVCQAGALCEEAVQRHQADWVSGWLLSEALTCATLASVGLKGAEKLTLRWLYSGPVGTILVDTTERGEVRGFPQRLRLGPKVTSLAQAIGGEGGRIAATTSLPDRLGHMGITEAVFGDVSRDLAHLFSLSFQVETALAVGLIVPAREPLRVTSATGVLLQPLPGADAEEFDVLRQQVERQEFRNWLEAAPHSPEEVLAHLDLLEAPQGLDEIRPSYACTCSRDKVESVLRMLDPAELREMLDQQGQAEVVCHFCATRYRFTHSELLGLLRQSQSGHA